MKKFLSILLAALCALLPMLALAQESTTIQTVVPSQHTITVVCGGHGGVTIDGKTYSGTFAVQAERLGTLTIVAQPEDGYCLSRFAADDPDGVTVNGNTITLSGVHGENTLTLSFAEAPAPTATPTPVPTEAPTATAAATATVTPTATAAATATVTPTATATAAPTAEPASNETSLADTVVLPQPSPQGNILYDDYLGTGSGLEQLSILFCGEYRPRNYELLDVHSVDGAQGSILLVRADSDANGNVDRRSLMLSVAQLVRLAQDQQAEQLIFENGEGSVSVELADLQGGKLRKLIGLIAQGEAVSEETLNRDWEEVPLVSLTAQELESVRVEICIIPVELSDGSTAYDYTVWLRWGDQALEISDLLPSLRVYLNADGLEGDEDALQYAVGYRAEEGQSFQPLESTQVQIPEELPENRQDAAEKFIVTIPEDGSAPVTVYDATAPLASERHSALMANYAGKGLYRLLKTE